MGKVARNIDKHKNINGLENLKDLFNVNLDTVLVIEEEETITYKNVELDSILVNIIESNDEIKLEKLVSLKAFLLSKEQKMDINNLLFNIDRVMKLSNNGLTKKDKYILLDNELEAFIERANIKLHKDTGILSDGKRKAKVIINDNMIDFNSITEI